MGAAPAPCPGRRDHAGRGGVVDQLQQNLTPTKEGKPVVVDGASRAAKSCTNVLFATLAVHQLSVLLATAVGG